MPPPLVQMTSNPVMGEPPSEAGVAQDTVSQLSVAAHAVAVTWVGAPGTVALAGALQRWESDEKGAFVSMKHYVKFVTIIEQ